MGKVDATVEKDLAKKYGVKGYPTLQFFKSGEAEKYTGNRKAEVSENIRLGNIQSRLEVVFKTSKSF